MTDVVMDIETVAVPPESMTSEQLAYIERSKDGNEPLGDRLALHGWTCEVCTVAMLNPETMKGKVLYRGKDVDRFPDLPVGWAAGGFAIDNEKGLLAETWKLLEAFSRVITYNGRGFDLPVLAQRSLVLGLSVPFNPSTYRYSFKEHLDLVEALTFFGATRRFPLGFICDALGVESPKHAMKGSDVESRWREGRYTEIAEYCAKDVVATAALFGKVQSSLGVMLAR